MSNEQVKELLDMVMALPQSDNYSIKFEYCTDDGDISIFVHGKKRCECCGRLKMCPNLSYPTSMMLSRSS